LSPWWLRPTSEGAENEDREKEDREKKEERRDAAAEAAAAAGAPASESAGAASPSQQPAPPARPTYSEPYRAFWQPRETEPDREQGAPAARTGAPPAAAWQPPAEDHDAPVAGAAAAAPERSGGSEAPWAARSRGSEDRDGEAPAPGQGAGDLHPGPRGEPRGPHPFAAPFAGPAGPADGDLDLAAEGEGDGEGDAEEHDEESRAGGRKRRPRRRGGRRKNGRAAAGTGAPESAEDEDDEAAGDEAMAQFPSAVPSQAPRVSRAGESYVIPADHESTGREIIISVPDRQRPQPEERKIAMFCDFENIALGVRDSDIAKLDIGLILERLLEKGKIIVKKAYADWERYNDYKRPFHEAAIELIDIPQKFYSGKNSADIKMVVDAMDLSYSKEHLDTFVILSGDSDFSPLVSKLKENNKYVIGIGVKNSSSNLLVDNCDEFIYYEDIWRDAQKGPKLDGLNKKTAEAFSLMIESIQALLRENKDVLWGSMIKQTMQRKKPSFNEGYYGYSTFSELLEDAARKNIIKLKKDQRSGTYIVTGFAKTGDAGTGRRQG
jgi:uncharacterized protein (TIGR00288 family)